MTTNTAGSETVSAVLRALRERLEIAEDFPDDVLDEAAASAEAGLADMALADRREYPFVTIDPPDSMDLDQAVHIEREGEGYLVRYAISAVGLFIRPGGALERETHRRTQTVYGPDGSIPLHPHALSHGAASLLPNEDRPAYLWYLHLNPDGELRHKWVELALVRSVAKLSYEQVQDAVDGRTALDSGVPGDFPELLRRVGSLRVEREIARGGVSLALPEQVVEKGDGGYRLAFRALTDVEKWNAQISLVTGMAAADIMSRAAVGVLRTMPPAMPRDVDRLRSVARALRLDWPDDVDYREFVRSVGGDTPAGAAFLTEAASLFRGAGYHTLPLFGWSQEQGRHRGVPAPEHAALASRYAHVTAPLRRLVDRYGLEICRCVCAGEGIPQWVYEGLYRLPTLMTAGARVVCQYENAALDAVEALVLAGREGEEFEGVVVDVFHRRRREGRKRRRDGRGGAGEAPGGSSEQTVVPLRGSGTVMLGEPAVLAPVVGDGLERGREITAVLRRVDLSTSTVEFEPVRVDQPA
jgi:putative exoribonuclease